MTILIGLFILDVDGDPVRCLDVLAWAEWMWGSGGSDERRRIALDHVGSIDVSTVFLGIDHGFRGGGPVLFETMIFGGRLDGWQRRYSTRAEALVGHAEAVALASAMGGLAS